MTETPIPEDIRKATLAATNRATTEAPEGFEQFNAWCALSEATGTPA